MTAIDHPRIPGSGRPRAVPHDGLSAAHVQASPVTSAPLVPHPVGPAPAAPPEPGARVATGLRSGDVPAPLTKREIEVLVGMSHGRSNAQIGQELYLSEDTIKTHARRLFRKLGAADRAQAVAIGLRRGLIR